MRLLVAVILALAIAQGSASQAAFGFEAVLPAVGTNLTALNVLLNRDSGATLGFALLRLAVYWDLASRNRQSPDGTILSIAVGLPGGAVAALTDQRGLPFAFNASTAYVAAVAAGLNVSAAAQSAMLFFTVVRLIDTTLDGTYGAFFTSRFVTGPSDAAVQAMLVAFNTSYGAPGDAAALQRQFGISLVWPRTLLLSNDTRTTVSDANGTGLPSSVIIAIVAGSVAMGVLTLGYLARKRKMADDEAFAAKYGRPLQDGQSPLLKHYQNLEGHGRTCAVGTVVAGSPQQQRSVTL